MSELVDNGISDEVLRKQKDWIKYPVIQAKTLRDEAQKAGENPDVIIAGCVMSLILNDDGNALYTTMLSDKYLPKEIEYSRNGILGRLSLEIGFKETPEEIRKQLVIAQEVLQKHDWSGKKGFDGAHAIWKEFANDWVRDFRETNPKMKEAYEKFVTFDEVLARSTK